MDLTHKVEKKILKKPQNKMIINIIGWRKSNEHNSLKNPYIQNRYVSETKVGTQISFNK